LARRLGDKDDNQQQTATTTTPTTNHNNTNSNTNNFFFDIVGTVRSLDTMDNNKRDDDAVVDFEQKQKRNY